MLSTPDVGKPCVSMMCNWIFLFLSPCLDNLSAFHSSFAQISETERECETTVSL